MQSYLSFLKFSLGLDHVILPQKEIRFHFHCANQQALSLEEQALFLKIMDALKLSPSEYIQTVGAELRQEHTGLRVVFTDDETDRGVWKKVENSKTLYTYSLAAMLQDQQCKKNCWLHLRDIKNHL